MSDRLDERLLAYLEGHASQSERDQLEQELAASPPMAAELEEARRGLDALRGLTATESVPVPPLADAAWDKVATTSGTSGAPEPAGGRDGWSPGLRRAAVIAALLFLPSSGWVARGLVAPPAGTSDMQPIPGVVTPPAVNPTMQNYLLVFFGSWEGREALTPQERMQRQEEYMMWLGDLEANGRVVNGSELEASPGLYLTSAGMGVSAFVPDLPPEEIITGFVYIRAENPEEARRIAEESPHVRYGSGILLKGAGLPW